MLRFLHGYMDLQWKGLIKRGMIDDTSGVKFHQCGSTAPENSFNELAAVGGPVYEIVRECNRPFYVDRYAGGCPYYEYDYDKQLMQAYVDLCGEWMLGFQFHEWISNIIYCDWRRITQLVGKDYRNKPEEMLRTFRVWKYDDKPYWSHSPYYTVIQSAQEYLEKDLPINAEETIQMLSDLFAKRQQQMDGLILPTDSDVTAVRLERQHGVRNIMPEVGAQTPFMRIQVALARGTAKDAGIKWGTYYEPWGGEPLGCCYYKKDWVNEWNISGRNDVGYAPYAPTNGSSRALQKRVYYFSLLSGADFLSEEHGTANTFYDWEDYELTPYGLVKQEFLRFASKHRNLGDTVTPVALVLPKDFEMVDVHYLQNQDYLSFPVEKDKEQRFNHIRTVLTRLLHKEGNSYGNEGHCISNGSYGDVFDIVYEDAKYSTLEKYDVLIDLDPDNRLKALYPDLCSRIIESKDISAMEHMLNAELERILPCQITGKLSWVLNRVEDGYALGLFNNEGMHRCGAHGGDKILHDADTVAVVNAPGKTLDVLLGDPKLLSRDGDNWYYDLKATEVVILNIK